MLKLRRYQIRGLENFKSWISRGFVSDNLNDKLATIILPTGTGKTKLAVSCVKHLFENKSKIKVLWVAHREELIDQAYNDFVSLIPSANVQIEMADRRASPEADIVVGSVQTLYRERKNIKEFVPDLIIVDEWHHYHEKNVQYHGLAERYTKAKILGLTATPFRFVGGDLPTGEKLIEMDIGTAIAHGYLVPPKPEILKSDVSLANVKTRAGDFAINELSETINVKERNWLIVKRVLSAINDEKRRGIVYAADVAHSKALAEMFRGSGARVAEIYGETPKEERRELMDKIKNGEIDVFCNNLLAVEGFDVPYIDFICVARPTKSLGLFYQMIGRGLRLFEEKKDCLIIDIFDKIKVSQSVANYNKLASYGDIDGSRRRSSAIMKENIADKLINFPVFMRLKADEIWSLDEETWIAPAWQTDTNQWVVTWSKRQERVLGNNITWKSFYFTPSKKVIQKSPLNVKHDKHGVGIAQDIIYGKTEHHLVVMFNEGGKMNVPLHELMIGSNNFEMKKLDKPLKRAFYIISNDNKSYCRVISLLKSNDGFSVESDIKGDQNTVNEVIKSFAQDDDMLQIIKADAAWRKRPASDKQKYLIKKMITWGKLSDSIDIDSLTGGDASALMEQSDWKPIINDVFGGKNEKELIGYLSNDDV